MSKHSDQDQELAHEMVVEMLAHQFAYPVKWIDTQDVLLDRQKTERLIEIGPSDTLTVMAKRTIKSKYEAQDATLSRRRQLLSGDTDLAEIYYEVDPQPAPAEQSSGNGDGTNDSPPPYSSEPSSSEGPKPSPTPGRTKAARSSMKKPDAPISAQEILVGIIAQKLKKASGDITATSTIKSLASGRSTLENEIIGDLVNEFGTVPDRAEEVAIQDLGKILQSSFGERLGKQTSRMVEQLLASKMPGGFSTNSARKYLDSRWGLGEGRQDSCLMAAVVSAPAVRLPTEQAAHQFFDDIATKHIAAAGLSSLQENDDDDGDALTAAVDPEALRKLKEEQNEIARKKLELYAEQLQIDLQAGLKSYAVAQNTINELEAQLDLWTREHGDVYAAGIKPMVDNRKVRVYDSWWNWALQDAFTLFHELTTGSLKADDRDLASRTFRIVNRSTPKLVEVLKFMVTNCQNEDGNTYKAAEGVIEALIAECQSSMGQPPVFRNFASSMAPQTIIADDGKISITEVPRIRGNEKASIFVVKRKGPSGWLPDEESTSTYLECFGESSSHGIDFEHRVVLLTGAGSGSIGSELLRGLLSGGAKVIVTTSSFSLDVTRFYQNIYMTYGATGSQLVVVPFNQGSQQDIDALLSYIYDTSKGGLGWDLDAVIPFAAISEKGREIDGVDSKSQLAHRIMLTNTVQMIGAIKRFKVKYGSDTRPAQVILPLSPNHGNFGGDGLYAESKLALESLFDKWKSESWSNYLSICGASIGWTRGTGLMSGNDIVAEEIEKLGVRTFSQQEMATSILALMAYPIVEICQTQPLYADLNGGLGKVPNLPDVLSQIRKSIIKTADIRRALAQEVLFEGNPDESLDAEDEIDARANISLGFPDLPTSADLQPLAHLKGMVDLERVVVITGFSELGPYGNARTRWEMEAYGKFSLEGCVEMAWIMGLIRYSSAGTNGSKSYSGWLDAKTNEPVEEWDIKRRYEKHILENSGIRLVDPELWDGYDPHKKQAFQEVVVEQNLKSFEASKETAEAFRREHGEKVDILEVPESSGNTFTVRIKKGAVLMIPKALDFGNDVAGQIPSGWNPRTYGITEEIIASVDRITLYVLICTIESLLSAGISDPYEIYQYVHTSQVGNCVGSGAGGIISLEKIHRARAMEKPASQDVLQETFNNTIAAWVNMLIMSSNGPIRTPVGACATAIESLDNAYDLIISGKAKLCLVGGVDDLQENTSYEFANMKATSNGALEHAAGRDPKEMSRPTASTRKGFMESQGCGMQVVCTARVALDMGLPIYGIVAFTGTSSDKIGRSVPAPGKGLMVHATEARAAFPSPFLDIKFRRRQLMSRLTLIKAYEDSEHQLLESEIEAMRSTDSTFDVAAYRAHRTTHINYEVTRQKADALDSLGNTFWKNHPEIAPMRGALATWGLTIDDLSVCSFHGTSTIMNERNECDVLQRELGHLGRAKGNRVLGVFQKYLTGHPKGAAGAWMMNGGLQILQTGLVPGNRNADNIDSELEKFDYIAFPNRAIQTTGVKAFSVFSFGFGQKGAQAIIVHPKYLFATLEGDEFELYKGKLTKRQRTALRTFNKGFLENRLFVAKDKAPFAGEKEMDAMLNPRARLEVKKDGNLLG